MGPGPRWRGGGGPVKSSSTAIHELLLEMSFHPSTLSEKETGIVRADEGRVSSKVAMAA